MGCLPCRLHWFLPGEGCRGCLEVAVTLTLPDVLGNGAADELAKVAAMTHFTRHRQIPYHRSPAQQVYGNFFWKADNIATSNWADVVLLARLRSGHAPLLKACTHLLDPAADPTCPLCKEEPQTLEHLQSESSRPTPRRCWRSLGP